MGSTSKTASLSADLNSFIYGVSKRSFLNAAELTKTGLTLLKTFPAARDAVLEYFAMVFHEAVNISVNQADYDVESNTGGPLESVSIIGPELTSLGESWASVIAPWCINLIMDIATDKANLPNATLQNADPVRVLLDITTQNLTLLNNDERAKCIDMMISSGACSWAVGWVGRAEPALVAPRALALGPDAARAVLQHLAHHPPALTHVRQALTQKLQEALKEDGKPEKRREIIPYLLNLASKSDIVLKALTQDIEKTFRAEVVDRLCVLYSSRGGSAASEPVSVSGLVTLLLRCPVSCLLLLLDLAATRRQCRLLLEYLLQKLEYESLFSDTKIPLILSAADDVTVLQEKLLTGNQLEQYSIARVLILVCYHTPTAFINLISFLLQYSRTDTTLALLLRIVSGTISMHTPNDSSDINLDSEKYINYVKTGVECALRGAMVSDTQIKMCFVEGNVPKDQKTYLHHYCLNLHKLLRWECATVNKSVLPGVFGAAAARALSPLAAGLAHAASLLRERRPHSCSELNEMPTCHAVAQLLDRVDMSGTKGSPPSVEVIVKLLKATVNYFFRCLHETDILSKIRGVQTACRLLRKLCIHSKLARAIALRDLLETAMFKEEAVFGSKSVIDNTVTENKDWTKDDLLLHLNQKHGPITQLTQSHTSVFHAGIIGGGVRRRAGGERDRQVLTTNNQLLCGALMACMDGNSGVVEGCTAACLLLVELAAPDVMYNGLPWPDEDFTKQVSIERELYMRAALGGSCVARAALRLAAAAPPALCLASALLRAHAATLLHTLTALLHRSRQSEELARERGALHELLATMTLGQLLPPPLAHMLLLVDELTCGEIVQMLRECVWNYTRDHVPSPALFACDASGVHWRDPSTCKPPATYTDTLRLIIQKRISTLGHLYPIMFLNLENEQTT